MFIFQLTFPSYRHERAPISYRFNTILILIALLNLMITPAYGQIGKMVDQHKLNQRYITEVANGESLADVITEMKKILITLSPNKTDEQQAAYDILEMSDPVLKQGKSKQYQRLKTLISVLPEKFQTAMDELQVNKEELLSKKDPNLDEMITAIDEQLKTMQENYEQLESYASTINTKAISSKSNTDSQKNLLSFISKFSAAPHQQTKNGPGNLIQGQDNRIDADARTKPEQFSEERAISLAQMETAKVISSFKNGDILFGSKTTSPPSFGSSLANSGQYKGESDEVQITDRIKQKAADLNYNPAEIYYWVRNNIEFVPTWGAYQTAEHTLGSGQGNSFDTSSLLIALLRASNIPARYVQGSIRISPEEFTNWIGDFDDVESALIYAGQNGARVTSLIDRDTNQIVGVEIEHAWVEAAIDYQPSRGMVNKTADTWIPMDASFKQYEYLKGIDTETVGEIDAEQIANDFQNSGSVNEDEGWVQGLDSSIIEQVQQQAQEKVEAYIDQMTDPTVGEVVGGNKVIVKSYPMLGATLENEIVVRGADYIDVPFNYQAQIGLAMQPVLASGLIPIPQPDITDSLTYYPLSQFNSEKLTLRFSPATEADQAALNALIPEDADSVDDLPTSIGSGVNVIPELVLNGEVIMTGQTLGIGHEVELGMKARLPNVSNYYSTLSYNVIAGSYLNIPIVGYSVNPYALVDTQSSVESTQSILESEDETQLANLTRNEILGDLFYTGGLGYFAQLHTMNMMASQQSTGIGRVLIGYGSYGYEPKQTQSGILAQPTGISPGSIATNVRVHQIAYKKGNDKNDGNIAFVLGMNSSNLESAISEQLFCNEEMNPDNEECYGISTVSGLQRAASQGQKIYQINQNNRDQLSNIAMSDENMASDINVAINSGGYVIVPESAVDGTGRDAIYVYMTYNGQTGAQSWKISGGLNGGMLSFFAGLALISSIALMALIGPAAVIVGISVLSAVLLGVIASIGIVVSMMLISEAIESEDGFQSKCFYRGLIFPMQALTFISGLASLFGRIAIKSGALLFSIYESIMSTWGWVADVTDIETPGELDECKIFGEKKEEDKN